jgi:hypothetical protein
LLVPPQVNDDHCLSIRAAEACRRETASSAKAEAGCSRRSSSKRFAGIAGAIFAVPPTSFRGLAVSWPLRL